MPQFILVATMSMFFTFSNSAFASSEGMTSMPTIQPKRVFTVTEKDDLQGNQGFGDREPMIKMMNLMMVEGSGMEGMDMDMSTPTKLAANDKTQPKEAAVGEMKMGDAGAVKKMDSLYEIELKSSSTAKVGVNQIQFVVADGLTKKPAKGLKLKSQVSMTSMDMGVENPQVSEKAPGLYQVKAGFSMRGPWAVKIEFPDKLEKTFNFEAEVPK